MTPPSDPGDEAGARAFLTVCAARAIDAARGERLIRDHSRFAEGCWSYDANGIATRWAVPEDGRLLVVGAGKAAASVANGLEQVLGDRIDDGCIVVKHGHGEPLRRIRQIEAGHPVPDEAGVAGTTEMLRTLEGLEPRDRVFVILTGGASSLLVAPVAGVTLAEKAETTGLLLRSGAAIEEINAVRMSLSRVKGGGLLRHIAPAASMTLLISDVPGGDHGMIGSGPTIRSRVAEDPLAILERRGIADRVPPSVLARCVASRRDGGATPAAAGDAGSLLLADSGTVVAAACGEAAAAGLPVRLVDTGMTGNTHVAARAFTRAMRLHRQEGGALPCLFVSMGETTLAVRGNGLGGRNQEFALVAAMDLAGESGMSVLAIGTDGTDGPTDAAGAFASGSTVARAAALGVDARSRLAENDSYHFFSAIGDLRMTGPTGTNVMDLVLGIAW